LPDPIVTVVVPTLAADDALAACLLSLKAQIFEQFEVIVVDNSGERRVKTSDARVRVIANSTNRGFGSAVNQGIQASQSEFVATLNDDAVADPHWLERLIETAKQSPRAGMFASEVRMAGSETLDSAGMLIAADGSSKQRGHGEDAAKFAAITETLLPSGSAALYRRKMLNEIGLFDELFFLYCEDTDLGLRGRWAGWDCVYVPGAKVEHRYSHSSGRASPLKAYYVERNRLYMAIKNLPFAMLARAPWMAAARYFWHAVFMLQGRGKAAEFQRAGFSALLLPFLVLRAHASAIVRMPRLIGERRKIRKTARLSAAEFEQLLDRHSISIRQVAAL
jgi:GT2 family glycosyltransferase